MRWLSHLIPATILAIAVYFALLFGFDAVRILTSAEYGIAGPGRVQALITIADFIGLDRGGLLHLVAFFGALKLTAAAVLAIHIVDRIRTLSSGNVDHAIIDAGLLLVVLASALAQLPAFFTGSVIRFDAANFILAAVAVTFSFIERRGNLAPAPQPPPRLATQTIVPLPPSERRSLRRYRWVGFSKATRPVTVKAAA
jgi:hypothetical protein